MGMSVPKLGTDRPMPWDTPPDEEEASEVRFRGKVMNGMKLPLF